MLLFAVCEAHWVIVENHEKKRIHYLCRREKTVFNLTFHYALFFILYARSSIMLLSGPAYDGAVLPMQLIMPTVLLIGLTGIMGIQILVPLGKEKLVLYSVIAGAAADLILNLILIPGLGATGAAIGTLAAEVLVFAVQFFMLRKELRQTFRRISYYKIVLALLAGTAASIWVPLSDFGDLLTLLISAVMFFLVYYLVLYALKEDMVRDTTAQFIGWIRRKK